MKRRRGEARAVRRDSRPASRPALKQTKKNININLTQTNEKESIIPNISGVLWL